MRSLVCNLAVSQSRCILGTFLLAASTSPGAFAESQPTLESLSRDDFAYGMSLSPGESGALHTLLLPVEVYRGLARPGFADLRVVNRAGVQVPHAVRSLEPSSSRVTESARLPIFPLRGRVGAADPRTAIALSAVRDPAGTIIDIRLPDSSPRAPGTPSISEGPVVAYLVDASSLDAPLDALRVVFGKLEPSDQVLPVSIEASDDLTNFRAVGAPQTLVRLQYQGHQILRDRLDLPDLRARYLKLSWGAAVAPPLEAVHADIGHDVMEQIASPLRVSGKWGPSRDVALYDLGAAMPLDGVRLVLGEDNMLVRAAVEGAAKEEGPYESLVEGAFYRVRHGAALLESEAAEVDAQVRFIRVRISPLGGALGAAPPELEIQREPEQLLYAERGSAPFELVFGHHAATSTAFSPGELLSMLPDAAKSALPVSDSTVGPIHEIAGARALHAPPPPPPVKKYVLWAVLVAAVALLGGAAWRLARHER